MSPSPVPVTGDKTMFRVPSLLFSRGFRLSVIDVPFSAALCSSSSSGSFGQIVCDTRKPNLPITQPSSTTKSSLSHPHINVGKCQKRKTTKLAAQIVQSSDSGSQDPESNGGVDGDVNSDAEDEMDGHDVELLDDTDIGASREQPLPHGHPFFATQSKRRVMGSPVLALEGVAISSSVQEAVMKLMKSSNMREKHYRSKSNILQLQRATETYRDLKRRPQRGPPVVLPSPDYSPNRALSYLCTRFPGTFAANVYALSEIRRLLPQFSPKSLLDFGAGVGTSLLATARVLNSGSFAELAKRNLRHSEEDIAHCVPHMPIKHAWLIDNAPAMKPLATAILGADSSVSGIDILHTKTLSDGPAKSRQYDLVIASYSLAEYVRATMVKPDNDTLGEVQDLTNSIRGLKEKAAEVRLRRLIRTLWRRTAPGGLFVVIEDGTAAGFESVLFARELVLSNFVNDEVTRPPADGENQADDGNAHAESVRVIAPCVHSLKCPLDGSVTRRRICRFEQRLNRPPFQRIAYPRFNAFEDEYFSFIALQKLTSSKELDDNIHEHSWGRLVRPPLRRTRHISLDACTNDANLERRVVSKRKALDGYFNRARRSKWGDIWPVPPCGNPSPINF